MPVVTDLVANLVPKERAANFFLDGENGVAHKNFKYLITKSKLGYRLDGSRLIVTGTAQGDIADCAIVSANVGDKVTTFPASAIRDADNAYVVVVMMNEGSVEDVLMFPCKEIAKGGVFSIYKYLKSANEYQITIKNYNKLKRYSFGVLMKNYI